MRMPFGKFKGVELEDLPDSYLQWLLGLADLRDPLRTELEREWQFRTEPAPPPGPTKFSNEERLMVQEILTSGYRTMAKLCHPDRGGRHEAMVQLNAVMVKLRRMLQE